MQIPVSLINGSSMTMTAGSGTFGLLGRVVCFKVSRLHAADSLTRLAHLLLPAHPSSYGILPVAQVSLLEFLFYYLCSSSSKCTSWYPFPNLLLSQ